MSSRQVQIEVMHRQSSVERPSESRWVNVYTPSGRVSVCQCHKSMKTYEGNLFVVVERPHFGVAVVAEEKMNVAVRETCSFKICSELALQWATMSKEAYESILGHP